jgi:hypothetical protein
MDFNGDMILRSNLEDYAEAFVSTSKSKEISNYFESELKSSFVRRFENLHHRDEDFPEFEQTETNSLFPLQVGVTSGELVCSGKEDYTHNADNVAFVLPKNWHSGRVEPEELWEESELIITDAGEYVETNNKSMMEEDPFLTEDQKRKLVGDDDDEYDDPVLSGDSFEII